MVAMTLRPPAVPGRVLVLGDDLQTVTIVRSLARAGCEVTLGTDQRGSSTAVSRFLADVWIYDNASAERFCNHVEAFVRSERPDYVFPVGAQRLRALLPAGPRLERLCAWASPDFATLARCLDRGAMEALAAGLAIPLAGAGAPMRARRACHFAAAQGQLLAYFEQRLPQARSVAPSPELRGHCERLLASLGYTGTGCAMYAVDERGSAFLELVPGLAGTPELPYRMGLDFPLLALQLAAGHNEAMPPRPYPVGRTVRWPAFEWGDPLPALHRWWHAIVDAPLRRCLPKRLRA